MSTEKDFQTLTNEAAENTLAWIGEYLDAHHKALGDEDCDAEDSTRRQIEESPLTVQVRSGWYAPGREQSTPEEYEILLGTGGPATRIVGELDEYSQPLTAQFEFQDWFKPWTRAQISDEQRDVLLEFARFFYYGQ